MELAIIALLVPFAVVVSLLTLRTLRFATHHRFSFMGLALFTTAYVGIISTVINAAEQPELARNVLIGLHLPLLLGVMVATPRLKGR
ncbi:MAG: hypothetical protein TQ37_00040 [Candidatus Synechococcus spongiarum 15L]|uniref:Uncharacterized protein n=2 Tax=Candidatus Synechococcus spongiarum TaxID=431041 RepID=A0A1T1D121_9SYNE|nr:hypothetical protein [Candidatus Synechococcus spongiarum]KKZ14733.1 MAG: hypothetical protein TQ37_00040 [Candidatus Synechococcus spongiarum 15L]MCY4360268.1 hypothetical protein [Cyanobacteria bacterium MAG APA_bin_95]OOV34504.1 hypothetical protein BV53_05685 [Candidatus Synechococcus spongiarum LMB bulk15N]